MPQVEILSEQEAQRGWTFEAQSIDDKGILRRHQIKLSWADYNLWSADGSDEPGKVAEAVLLFLCERTDGEVGEKLDASMARRRFPDADAEIPRLIQR